MYPFICHCQCSPVYNNTTIVRMNIRFINMNPAYFPIRR